MEENLILLPYPRRLEFSAGELTLAGRRIIQLACPQPQDLLLSAGRLQAALKKAAGLDWELNASPALPAEQVGLTLELDPGCPGGGQGYRLRIDEGGMRIQAQAAPGIFYGVCTLIQILQQRGARLPCLAIEDFPDFPARGVMLDISRDKVPGMKTLYELVDRLASWKINQLQLYTEHTFAYLNHSTVWREASPLTAGEVLALDAYCRQRFIELVPNQNSFGHLTRWLIHPEYSELAETHGEFETPWGMEQGPYSLAPVHPGSLRLIRSLYDELLPNFSSRMVNVGCDETFDIGAGQSREACAQRGADRVMFDYLLGLYADVARRGLTMQFWADILVHHPHLLAEMPRDAVALLWNYEASQSFAESAARFQSTGQLFYVCPGTSAWNSLAGRHANMLANTLDAARAGLAHGALGYLNTDWGDNGHWQTLPFSLPGFAAGAAFSWCLAANQELPLEAAVSRFALEDAGESADRAVFRLANLYRVSGMELPNSSALFWLLQYPLQKLRALPRLPAERIDACLTEIDSALDDLGKAQIGRADATLVEAEIRLAARMLRHACLRGRLLNEVEPAAAAALIKTLKDDVAEWLEEYRRIWLERNRPGGLRESAGRIEKLVEEYQRLAG